MLFIVKNPNLLPLFRLYIIIFDLSLFFICIFMKNIGLTGLVLAALLSQTVCAQQVRVEQTFEKGWKFTREDQKEFSNQAFDDAKWQSVTVPHDWAIYGPFSIENDKQNLAIAQDGQKEAMEHAGRTGGLPFVGTGWYRLDFEAPEFGQGKTATLIFDGAMSHARVWLNGQEVGYWPYGYNSFHFDVTPYLKAEGTNTLAVRLENQHESSRWYPGAGLYRNVHLVINEDAHVPTWGTQLTTPEVNRDFAKVNLKTSLAFPKGKKIEDYRIVTELKDATGKVVAKAEKQGTHYDGKGFEQDFVVDKPALWSPDSPALYTAESKIYELLPERRTHSLQRRMQPPRPRPLGRHRQRSRHPPTDTHPERHGLQCHPYLAQHARPRTGGGLRRDGDDADGRIL